MKILSGIIILVTMIATLEVVNARSMRCNGQLVSIGDYLAEVADKCGDPHDVQPSDLYPDTFTSKLYDYKDERYIAPYLLKGPIHQEIWTYQFSPNRLPYQLYFRNGRLERLETGRR